MFQMVFGGGLGNQMFQYAYLYAQVRRNKALEGASIRAIMHHNVLDTYREFSLNCMNLSLKIECIEEKNAGKTYRWYNRKKIIVRKFSKKLNFTPEKEIALMKALGFIRTPDIYQFHDSMKISKKIKFVEGAFQSWKYFDDIRDELISEFKIIRPVKEACKLIKKEIEQVEAVCVHIRRGDYVSEKYSRQLAICDMEYYKKSMKYIADNVENPVFYIFSNSHNDHLWIQENYRFDYPVKYVDLENLDYEELYLMMGCKHFIISNSTFSWWAQYLSQNKSKIVVAPSVWNRECSDTDDIYMPEWKIIKI